MIEHNERATERELCCDRPREAVAIVLVNWNGWRDVIECLDSILGQAYKNFHVIIVDNASADGSVERIAEWLKDPIACDTWRRHEGVRRYTDGFAHEEVSAQIVDESDGNELPLAAVTACVVTVVRARRNGGFAAGCNIGIRMSATTAFPFIWLLNTDTVVDHMALDALVDRARQGLAIGMTGSTVVYYDRPGIVQALGGAVFNLERGEGSHIGEGLSVNLLPSDPSPTERALSYIFGASMLVSREFVVSVGLMAEDYFLFFEELDWAVRAGRKFRMAYAVHSRVFHKAGQSSSKKVPVFTANLYYRNRIRFVAKHYPHALRMAKSSLFREIVRLARDGHVRQLWIVSRVWWQADKIAREVVKPDRTNC